VHRLIAPLLTACFALPAAAAGKPPTPGRVPPPLRDLNKKQKIRLVYFIPTDRKPTADYAAKIEVVMTFVADLYRTSLTGAGYTTSGPDFEFNADGKLNVRLLRGAKTAAEYNGKPNYTFSSQWRQILPEVEKAFGSARKTVYVIFTEAYDPGPHKFEWAGGVALGARMGTVGGAGMFSAWILQDVFCATTVKAQLKLLADKTPIQGRKAVGCPNRDSPRFEFIEDGMGAVAHEVGHALALPHDQRNSAEYIMGNGFRRMGGNYVPGRKAGTVRFSDENCRILARSPYLAASPDPTDREQPVVTVTVPKEIAVGATSLTITVRATDNKALAGLVCFCSHGDSLKWGQALTGKEAEVTQTITFRPAKEGTIRIETTVIDEAGNTCRADRKVVVTAANSD
jgi:hypothetical protein